MFFYPNIFLYAAILLVAFFSMLIVGAGCMRLLPELYSEDNCFANVFVCLMSGCVVLVTLFALIITRCDSVMLLCVFIIAFYVLFIRDKHCCNNKFRVDNSFVKFSLLITGLLLLIYFVHYYIYFVRANGEIWCDYTFYSNVSCHIAKDHCENADLYTDARNAANYHWGDLWLTSLFGTLFRANYLYVLLLVTYPCFCLICVVGGCSVIYHLTKRKVVSIISGVGLLFAVPLMTIIVHWTSPVTIGSKLIVVYCMMVLSLLFYNSGRLNLSYVSLLLLVPFYSTVAPGVLTMVCVLSIMMERNNGANALRCVFNRVVVLSVLVTTFYIVFYLMQGNEGKQHVDYLYDDCLKNIIGFIVKRGCRVALLIPCAIGLLWYVSRSKKNYDATLALNWVVAVVSGVIVSAVVGGFVRQVMLDGGQITTNYSGPAFNVTCWFMAVMLFSRFFEGKYLNIYVSSLVLFYIVLYALTGVKHVLMTNNHVYAMDEIKSIEALRAEINTGGHAIGYYRNYGIEENFNTHKSRIRMFYPMDKMPHLVDNGYYAPYCLSALDIPDDLEPRWNEKSESELFKYMEQMKKNGSYTDDVKTILSFIKNRDIRYIVVENGCELPYYLEDDVVTIYDGSDKVYKINCN